MTSILGPSGRPANNSGGSVRLANIHTPLTLRASTSPCSAKRRAAAGAISHRFANSSTPSSVTLLFYKRSKCDEPATLETSGIWAQRLPSCHGGKSGYSARESGDFRRFVLAHTLRMEEESDEHAEAPQDAEATVLALVRSLAERQQQLALEGSFPFQQNWVGTAAQLSDSGQHRRPRLRVAGVQNLSREVLTHIQSGASTVSEIKALLDTDHPGAIDRQQVHRAMHQLTQRNEIRRVATGTYMPTMRGTD